MDAQSFQTRTMDRLGEFPGEGDFQRAMSRLISEGSALRTLVSLDRPRDSWLSDDDVEEHVGGLLVLVAEAACALGVDLPAAMARGCQAAEERLRSRAALIEQRRAAQRSAT